MQLIQLSLCNCGPAIVQEAGAVTLYDAKGLLLRGNLHLNLSFSLSVNGPFGSTSGGTSCRGPDSCLRGQS